MRVVLARVLARVLLARVLLARVLLARVRERVLGVVVALNNSLFCAPTTTIDANKTDNTPHHTARDFRQAPCLSHCEGLKLPGPHPSARA